MYKKILGKLTHHVERSLRVALFVFALIAGAFAVQAEENPVRPRTPAVVAQADGTIHAFDVELALSNAQRSLGLMYREVLAPNHGMLFIFSSIQPRSFWMRNCLIPLDIIFLKADGTIINIVANAEPGTDTQRRSAGPAKAVFEIPGGRAAELGIKPGDVVRHALLGNLKPSGSTGR